MKPVCVFYYGGWSSSIRGRLIATKPKYVVSDWGVWPDIPNTDVSTIVAAGITFCAYIPPGGMRGYKYRPDNIPQTPALIKGLIDLAVAKGFNGVFFDEGGVYSPWHDPDSEGVGGQALFGDRLLEAPGISSAAFYNGRMLRALTSEYSDYDMATAELWKGKTFETGYTNYAKSKGLFVCINFGINGLVDNLNPNVIESASVDAILSSEDYNTRESQAPMGIEVKKPGKFWVMSRNGAFDVTATQVALDMGFAAAYCCEEMGTLSNNYEPYMAQISDEVVETPSETRTVEFDGTVTSQETGLPITGLALIMTVDGVDNIITTNSDGKFLLSKVMRVGVYTAKVEYNGDKYYPVIISHEFIVPAVNTEPSKEHLVITLTTTIK